MLGAPLALLPLVFLRCLQGPQRNQQLLGSNQGLHGRRCGEREVDDLGTGEGRRGASDAEKQGPVKSHGCTRYWSLFPPACPQAMGHANWDMGPECSGSCQDLSRLVY